MVATVAIKYKANRLDSRSINKDCIDSLYKLDSVMYSSLPGVVICGSKPLDANAELNCSLDNT